VKHIEGDIELLKADLQEALGLQNGKDVVINQLTRHIIVKVCPELEHGGIAVC
jgi:hypothetical protein